MYILLKMFGDVPPASHGSELGGTLNPSLKFVLFTKESYQKAEFYLQYLEDPGINGSIIPYVT